MWIFIWVGFLLIGIAVLLPLYLHLLIDLKKFNPDEFAELGSPTLFMISPNRGLRLQGFIYSGSHQEQIHPAVRNKCRVLGILTPIYVILVFLILFWAVRMEMSVMN
ncbi:MAG: hypothetical protein OEM82_09085 [Acidobacteriota bacterium]|nr:hypothetical protein [Acidobacteriota bacterium]MDH3530806.1 hypothetical protein [Acidobacteriota bacterium]